MSPESFEGGCGCRYVRYRLKSADIHIFTGSKQPWGVLAPGVPAMQQYYDVEKDWPPESVERRRVLRNKLGLPE